MGLFSLQPKGSPSSIFCRVNLVTMNSFRLFLSDEVFVYHLAMTLLGRVISDNSYYLSETEIIPLGLLDFKVLVK